MALQADMGQQADARRKGLVRAEEAVPQLDKRSRPTEDIVRGILLFCGIVSIFTTIGILWVLGSQSALFFQSRAWVLAKAPVAEVEPAARLSETITTDDTQLSISFDGARIPFNVGQFIRVGEETMRITERGSRTIFVERGADRTTPLTHEDDTDVYAMREEQIKPLEGFDTEATSFQIADDFGREFTVGEEIQIGLEIMRVTDIDIDEEAGVSTLTVERGTSDTEARDHDGSETIRLARGVTIGEFLTSTTWAPTVGNFGIWPLLLSTLIISTLALLVSVPLGLGAAIYLSEYAEPNVRNTLKPILEILAGIPTVVYGFFALTFVTPLLQGVLGEQVQFYNMLSAGIVVGILLVPLIASMSEDALSAVPRALREASYGLGATRLETTVKIVLPAAVSGIMAAIILAASRAVGETMIVAIAAGAGPNFTFNIFTGAETMTGHIARISGGDLSYDSIDYNSIFSIGAMLFLMTLTLNLVSGWVRDRLKEDY